MGKKYSIQIMQELAIVRGGKCLSDDYINNRTKLEWKCQFGHIWLAQPRAIIGGQWCPNCASGLGERICRVVLECIFQEQFVKCRPKWLKSEHSNSLLELDGYCEKLLLAFEYNGHQHYRDTKIFKKSTSDQHKFNLCKNNNVKLIIIPQPKSGTPTVNYIKNITIEQSNYLNIKLPSNIENIKIDISKIYSSKDNEEFNKIKQKAILNGGNCLSEVYLRCHSKLNFQCGECNYIWKASPRDINAGSWCLKCAGKAYSMTDAIEIANKKEGKYLSKVFLKATNKLLWECKLGHQWNATYSQIKRGTWCPLCFRLKRKENVKHQ